MNPILKYVGGKTRLLPELTKRMPTTYGRYFEPFVGGGALFFHLELEAGRAVIGDVNASLIDMYMVLSRTVRVSGLLTRIWRALQDHERLHSKEHFLAVRRAWNARETHSPCSKRAAAYLYLGRAGFKGLWRENKRGDFNVPYGDGVLHLPDKERLQRAGELLSRARIISGPYDWSLSSFGYDDSARGDLVYFDPPYVPASATSSFASYSAGGFGADDQRRLEVYARQLAHRGCYVMLSNSDTPVTRELYSDTTVWLVESVSAPRSIGTHARAAGKVGEVIIRNVNVSGWGAW